MHSAPFYIALNIHLLGLILGLGSVIVTDLFGLLWILRHVRFTHLMKTSHKTEKFIWIGWLIMVGSGIPLFIMRDLLDNLLILKFFFVGIIAINGIFLYFIHKRLLPHTYDEKIPKIVFFRLSLGIAISQLGWWSAFAIGFYHSHIETIVNWPQNPFLFCSIILAAILLVWGVGETTIRRLEK